MDEQIDMRSGNLTYSVPLVNADGRGFSLPLNLSYNSQNWRLDGENDAIWNLGDDVGYGYGWTMQFGSLVPYYNDSFATDHYEFTDASGATYRLDQNTGGVWSSKESEYIWYDSNTALLHFRDGSFWQFGCISDASEQDAGTLYPTLIEDSNGNQIQIQYKTAIGATWVNSSARIDYISDVRTSGTPVYQFTYNTGSVPHLTSISNNIHSGEAFSLSYNAPVTLYSPFSTTTSFGAMTMLANVTNSTTNLSTSFSYDPADTGELDQVTFPYGGHIRWIYGNETLADNRTVRELTDRYLQWDSSIGEREYRIWRDLTGDSNRYVPQWRELADMQASAAKVWQFDGNVDPSEGLVTTYSEQNSNTGAIARQVSYTWAQDATSNNYISRTQTVSDPGQSYAVTKQVDQTLGQYGNVTQTKLYNYTELTTAAKTYTNTYLTGSSYSSRYIFNRLLSSTVSDGTSTLTLVTNTYDASSPSDAPGVTMHDSAIGVAATFRGNPTSSVSFGITHNFSYDITGTVTHADDGTSGHYANVSTGTATNYAAPTAITTGNSLTASQTWSAFLAPASTTGPNGDTTTTTYDQTTARPKNTASPYGALTTYSYSNTAPQITATVDGRWTKSYLDGLGRTYEVDTGDANGTKSIATTVYDTCGCTPIGKPWKMSMPYAPGATPVWKSYTYDTIGRTLTAVAPDGVSTTTYAYAGNVVTVTDPAGKWKQYTTDAFGELTQVVEPSPNIATEPNHVTTYTYDLLGHLTQVQMPRTVAGTVITQTRTWRYDPATQRLTSVTTPESGTVSYTYNSDGTLATRIDAKSQEATFSYDTYGRLTTVRRGTVSNGTFSEDQSQRTTYAYDTKASFCNNANYWPVNAAGRVSGISYSDPSGRDYAECYSYLAAGAPTTKIVTIETPRGYVSSFNLNYTYDYEGRMTSIQYPAGANGSPLATYNYGYDSMGRLNTMTDQNNNTLVSGVTYGPASEMLSLSASSFSETHTYNANLQLTELVTGAYHYQYNYSATQNNGRAASVTDVASGETITYQYDTLNRLTSASATGDPKGAWSQSFAYDGFGNLLQKTGSNAPNVSFLVNAANNRLTSNGAAYDVNGNLTAYSGNTYGFDVGNRLATAVPSGASSPTQYAYDASNQRVFKGVNWNGLWSNELFYLYGIDGKKLGVWTFVQVGGTTESLPTASTNQSINTWFGGRLLKPQDRLSSIGKYFPYGEDRYSPTPANPANDTEKFATYTRDSDTGLDYANQRYYSAALGRFATADPFGGSAVLSEPQTWNRYSYAGGDPVNANDPTGLCDVVIAGLTNSRTNAPAINAYASLYGDVSVYPYSADSYTSAWLQSTFGVLDGVVQVASQRFGANSSTLAAVEGLSEAAAAGTAINVTTWSGGAEAFTAAVKFLNENGASDVTKLINNITYVAPGAWGDLYNNGNALWIEGGFANAVVAGATSIPQTPAPPQFLHDAINCGHNFGCLAKEFAEPLRKRSGDACPDPTVINQPEEYWQHLDPFFIDPFWELNLLGDYGMQLEQQEIPSIPSMTISPSSL